MYLTVCPLVARVQFQALVEYFKGFFPGVTQPVDIKEELHPRTDNE